MQGLAAGLADLLLLGLEELPQGVRERLQSQVNKVVQGHGYCLHVAAAQSGSVSFMEKMIECGASFFKKEDRYGRTARKIALANKDPAVCAWASSVGTWLNRYMRKPQPVHRSATCSVYFAKDMKKGGLCAVWA